MDAEAPDPTANHNGKRLGELLIELGYLSPEDLARALRAQSDANGARKPIGLICVEMGFLSPERLHLILDRCGKRLGLSELLVARGKVSPLDIDAARELQKRQGGRLGEILIAMGCIDEVALAEALAEQYDLARISLAGIEPRPELARYVNAIYSVRHGVVPIGIRGRSLTVAIEDPAQRSLAADLESSTGLRVHVVLATKSEVEHHATLLYGPVTDEAADAPLPLVQEGTS